jgi:uncharacterized protein (TIGR00255 family)
MVLSMTGYGRATSTFGQKTITVEVRSLNSKLTDLRLRLQPAYREREHDIRKMILDFANRGKVEAHIQVRSDASDEGFAFNKGLFQRYCLALAEAADEIGIERGDIVQAVMRIPDVINNDTAELSDEEWQAITAGIQGALQEFQTFRKREGMSMQLDIESRVAQIAALLTQVAPFETQRALMMRQKITKQVEDLLGDKTDHNRLEQELIHYIEKIDITEEKLRLAEHCQHFLKQIRNGQSDQGRTLNFITQEIGREINTLGAKAYSSDIQKIVVQMKDELEKVKEIIANLV